MLNLPTLVKPVKQEGQGKANIYRSFGTVDVTVLLCVLFDAWRSKPVRRVDITNHRWIGGANRITAGNDDTGIRLDMGVIDIHLKMCKLSLDHLRLTIC